MPAAARARRRRTTCAASGRRRSRSCCAWTRCGAWRGSRRCWRSTSPALFLAIFTALCLKAGRSACSTAPTSAGALNQTKDFVSFAFLVTRAAVRALRACTPGRDQRPGLTRIVAGLFQTTVVALLFALVNGLDFPSYYIFYGSLFFAVAYVGLFRYALRVASTGRVLRAAGYRRRAVLVGTGEHIDAVAHALTRGGDSPVNIIGFVSLAERPDNGLSSLGSVDDIGEIVADHRVDEVIIADPAFPEQEAIELVDQCHQRGVTVRIAPSTMEILVHRAEFVPGQSVPLFELRPPVFEGFDYLLKRSFDLVGASLILLVLSPLLLAVRARREAHLARARCSTARCGRASAGSRSRASSSARCTRRRRAPGGPRGRSTRPPARCSRSATTRG